jgi:hypothetical protein
MVEQFGKHDAAAINLPYVGGDERQPEETSPCGAKDVSLYISIVGILLYAAVATRPDITEIVNRLCRNMQAPTTQDIKKALRCLRYLKGTSRLGIQYSALSGLIGYVDIN